VVKKIARGKVKEKDAVSDKIERKLYPVVLEFFCGNDFHRIKLKDISTISGVSTATIYKYFNSKEALIFSILEYHMQLMIKEMKSHLQGIESTREKWRKLFWVIFNHYDNTPGLAVTFFITVPTGTWMQEPAWPRRDMQGIFLPIIREGKERGEIDNSLTETQIVGQFFMHLGRAVQLWYYHKMKWPLVDSINRFFPVFWKTVSSQNSFQVDQRALTHNNTEEIQEEVNVNAPKMDLPVNEYAFTK